MKRIAKVVWSEGMFLTPHLFQQADDYHESLLHLRVKVSTPFHWGLTDLEIDREALINGQVSLIRCSGILPDGLPIQIPDGDEPPETRSIQSFFSPSIDRVGIYLAIPASRSGANVSQAGAGGGGRPVRYRAELVQVTDETAETNEGEVPLARKNFKLLFTGESLEDTVWIKVGDAGRTTAGSFELAETYVPPALTLPASPRLLATLRHLLELLTAKSTALSQQRRHVADFGSSDMANFWLLHTVNSWIPILSHFFNAPARHPEHLYLALAQLVGELSTFALDADPRDLPAYDHEDLGRTFGELERKIRFLLETIIPTRYVIIPLEKTRELLHVGRVQDERLLKTAQFYLAVSAQMSAGRLIEEVPAKAKISSPEQIGDLIGRAVPGVELIHEPVPPSAIPVKAGFKYFHLSAHGRSWEHVGRARALALFLPDEFPEMKLELVAVKP
jgi:type VI secretion system protein ImpJ